MIDMDINSLYPWQRSSLMNIKPEYLMRVLNKKYWPHQVEVSVLNANEVERWCYERFKSSEWRNVGRYFAFKQGADATAFALRWL
jgi:hypothetical protein